MGQEIEFSKNVNHGPTDEKSIVILVSVVMHSISLLLQYTRLYTIISTQRLRVRTATRTFARSHILVRHMQKFQEGLNRCVGKQRIVLWIR